MSTVLGWAAQGWRWWITELAAMLPARMRDLGKRRWPQLHYGDRLLKPAQGTAVPKTGARVTILLADTLFLTRRIERPAVSKRDLERMLVMEGGRLLPFSSEGAMVAGRIVGTAASAGRAVVVVAGIPRTTAREIGDAIAASGFSAGSVLGGAGDGPAIDFAPAMWGAGLLARHRSLTPTLWAIVGMLALLNIMAAVWLDIASVGRFEQLVQAQQPAVTIARKIRHRVEVARAMAQRTTKLRGEQDALGTLAAVGLALPQGAWLTRAIWDGRAVRLSGYRPADADVATALRNAGGFREVETGADDLQAALPTGEPFDLTARRGRK